MSKFDATRRASIAILAKLMGAAAIAPVAIFPAAALAEPAPPPDAPSPEVKLINDYNDWFILQGNYLGDIAKMRAGLPRYITDRTVLHEAESLPWGGTMVGYDGWERLCRISGPIWGKVQPSLSMSDAHQYQQGNIVINEITVHIAGTKTAPQPFVMAIIEKYTVEGGRIMRIDEFYSDTAGFLAQLKLLGALPPV